MAYRTEGSEIIIDGWENGISDNPYKGINDMRGVNIVSIPGEASVSFQQTLASFTPFVAHISSADPSTDRLTIDSVSSGDFPTTSGCAIIFSSQSGLTGITMGVVYWMFSVGSSTFKIATDPSSQNVVDITATGTAIITSVNIGEIRYFDKSTGIALDKNGRAWYSATGTYTFLGNSISGTIGLTNTIGNGLIWYKGYLFLFYNSRICYMAYSIGLQPTGVWINEWDPTTGSPSVGTAVFNTATGESNLHYAITGINDDTIYITDGSYVSSLFQKSGAVFNPANTTTYSWAKQAIANQLPGNDIAQSLAELGSDLLIGGIYNAIYPWNRISTGPRNAILVAENNIAHLLTVNTNTYIFAGKRGRIYKTNGSQAEFFMKIPDHIIGGIDPQIIFNGVAYNKNQIYFGVSTTTNQGNPSIAYRGLWAIDITTNVMRVPALQSNNNGIVTAIFSSLTSTTGFGLFVAWKTIDINGNTVLTGIDNQSSQPYSSYASYITTDIIPIGQFLKKRTLSNVEFKLTTPLIANEGIKISYRTNMSEAYTLIGETTTAGALSDYYLVNFDLSQWLQFKIEMKSTANGSFVRLYEIRLR